MYHILLIHSPVDGRLSSSHPLAIMNDAALNSLCVGFVVHVCLCVF
jgi:hypothetical protein